MIKKRKEVFVISLCWFVLSRVEISVTMYFFVRDLALYFSCIYLYLSVPLHLRTLWRYANAVIIIIIVSVICRFDMTAPF